MIMTLEPGIWVLAYDEEWQELAARAEGESRPLALRHAIAPDHSLKQDEPVLQHWEDPTHLVPVSNVETRSIALRSHKLTLVRVNAETYDYIFDPLTRRDHARARAISVSRCWPSAAVLAVTSPATPHALRIMGPWWRAGEAFAVQATAIAIGPSRRRLGPAKQSALITAGADALLRANVEDPLPRPSGARCKHCDVFRRIHDERCYLQPTRYEPLPAGPGDT